jgi:hypothetical protein
VLACTDERVLQNGRVAGRLLRAAARAPLRREIPELSCTTALYEVHAILCRALRLEYDEVPERIVEVAAPGGAAGDFMGGVGASDPR